MTPFQYLARNYVRNQNPNHMSMDEWWEDDVNAYRAYLAGAMRLLYELQALRAPGAEAAESLLLARLEDHAAFFIAKPLAPGSIFSGGLFVRLGESQWEPLAEAPCPRDYREHIAEICRTASEPSVCEMAFRMVQEFHGRSPEMVVQLGSLLFDHLMDHYDVYLGFSISFEEVMDFCDRMIAEGHVTLKNIPFPFIQSDQEEDNLEWLEAQEKIYDDLLQAADAQEQSEALPPTPEEDDDVPF